MKALVFQSPFEAFLSLHSFSHMSLSFILSLALPADRQCCLLHCLDCFGFASRNSSRSQLQKNTDQRIIILQDRALVQRTSAFICKKREINICRCNISWSIAMSNWLEGLHDWCMWLITVSHSVCFNVLSFHITSYVKQSNHTRCPLSSSHWGSYEQHLMNGMWMRRNEKKKWKYMNAHLLLTW